MQCFPVVYHGISHESPAFQSHVYTRACVDAWDEAADVYVEIIQVTS